MRARSFILAGAGLAFVAACGDSAPTVGSPEDAGGADSAATSPLTLWIYEPILPGESPTPIAGAVVAFDPAEGDRVEKVTDTGGRVTFESDISKGGATVTAFAADHVITTIYALPPGAGAKVPGNHLGKPPDEFVMFLGFTAKGLAKRTVKLRGTITNKLDAANPVFVQTTPFGWSGSGSGSQYLAYVPRGRPFLLLGTEQAPVTSGSRSGEAKIQKMFAFARDPLSADDAFDIDVKASPPVPSTTLRLHLEITGGDGGPLGGSSTASCAVQGAHGHFTPGFAERFAVAPDKSSFDCDVVVAQVDAGEPLVTGCAIKTTDGAASSRYQLGIAADGTTFRDFLAPPHAPEGSIRRNDPLPLGDVPPDDDLSVLYSVYDGNGAVLWSGIAYASLGLPESLVIPRMPTGASLPRNANANLAYTAATFQIPGISQVRTGKAAMSRPFAIAE